MYLFQEESPIQFIKEKDKSKYGKYTLTFNKPLKNPKIEYLFNTDSADILSHFSTQRDSLTIWYNQTFKADTFNFVITDYEYSDTLFLPTIKADTNSLKPLKLIGREKINRFNFSKSFAFQFSYPTVLMGQAKAVVSDTIPNIEIIADSNNPQRFYLDFEFEQYQEYTIFIEPNSFQDFYGRPSDSINISLTTEVQEHYGTLKLILEIKDSTDENNFILELLNKDGNAIEKRSVSKKDAPIYKFLNPGTYSFRLIYDANNDGVWTTGNYLSGRQPEKIVYFIKKINVRSNWDFEEKWIIK